MAIQFNPSNIGSGLGYASQINNLFSTLATALEDAVSRSGYGANAMSADLDLGNNDLLNVGRVNADELYVDGAQLASLAEMQNYTTAAQAAQAAAETARYAAETAQAAAEAAAAGVSLPSIQAGDADKLLVVKNDESGFELLADLPADSVPTAAIEDSAVTAVKLGSSAVTTDKINNGDITQPKLASTIYATKAQAEAGTNSTKLMTPQRTEQWHDAKYPAAATNFYEAGNRLYLADNLEEGSSLDYSTITGAAETVGPTGSGATNIWAALDALPSDAKSIVITTTIHAESTGAGFTRAALAVGRDGVTEHTAVSWAAAGAAEESGIRAAGILVPVDGNNIFLIKAANTNVSSATQTIGLEGYVV